MVESAKPDAIAIAWNVTSCVPAGRRNVPLLNSEQMYQALRTLNVPSRLIIYPGETHGLEKPSYLKDRLTRYLDWYGQYLR